MVHTTVPATDPPGHRQPAAELGLGLAPDVAEDVDEVERNLIRLFTLVAQAKVVTGEGQPPLERAGYVALAHLVDHGPLRASALALRLGVDVSTASRQAAALETAGLVSRDADPADGRAWLIAPTRLGVETLDHVRTARRSRMAVLLAGWTHDERVTFADLLARFTLDLDSQDVLSAETQPTLQTRSTR